MSAISTTTAAPLAMFKLSIVLVIFLGFSQHLQCSVLEYMTEKLNELKHVFVTVFSVVQNSLISEFNHNRDSRHVTSSIDQHRKTSSNFQIDSGTAPQIRKDIHLVCVKTAHAHTTPQLAATHGRIVETHVTYTEDGYILTLHRLCSSKSYDHSNSQPTKRTVLLHHGILGSSADWLQLGSKKSLPYILSDAGHDVWLANARGNFYSRAHVSMTTNSEEYWNFSWEEIGEHDLSAAIDYIRQKNNSTEPIDYIGHSMGATALLVLLSVKRNYNQYFRMAFLLAPLVYMEHTRGPLQTLATIGQAELTAFLGTREFMPTRTTSLALTFRMCKDLEIYCKNPLFFLAGSPLQEGSRTADFTEQLQEYIPAGGSTKTIMHYIGLVKNKQFHRREKPDWKFKLKYITTPIVIFSSSDDFISSSPDNHMLFLSIPNPVGHILISDKNLSHTEFVWGYKADVLLYYKIKDLIDLDPDINKI